MINYNTPEFDDVHKWIEKKIQLGCLLKDLEYAGKGSDEELERFLDHQKNDNFWPNISADDWKAMINEMLENEEANAKIQTDASIIHSNTETNDLTIPNGRHSAWQNYKAKLLEKGYPQTSVDEIENSCFKTLKELNKDTTNTLPIKGMVVGNVQSGKTGHMVGLMAMAADWGWNVFIVLTGMMENLRIQNMDRIVQDLNDKGSQLSWINIEHPGPNMPRGFNVTDLELGEDKKVRYVTGCLKQSQRLKNLNSWLQKIPHAQMGTRMQSLKILVIDDEADQASINTRDIDTAEKTAINQAICNIINGKDNDGNDVRGKYKSMNYIGYTATPYANVLNEPPSETSLFPSNFIISLKTSKEYFGPQQIFGIRGGCYDGLDIIRQISNTDNQNIKDLQPNSNDIPDSLKNSICWFLCCVACMRYWKSKKPISMLIHTSQQTNDHDKVSKAIANWFNGNTSDSIINMCKILWNQETAKFTKKDFFEQYPDYGHSSDEVMDYPDFELLKDRIKDILSINLTHIPLDAEGRPEYHKGIHMCIDNCKNNRAMAGEKIRLIYPEHDLDFASAFIVIGGATLSRGLTISGLVSTYFLRTSRQADTLMQMGRWFGYRVGYELLPRIWMTDATKDNFEYLSDLDDSLRREIQYMASVGMTPEKYGVEIKNSPKYLRVTANNRMQGATTAQVDFSGTNLQTYLFDTKTDILQSNFDLTTKFLRSLNRPSSIESCCKNAIVWTNIEFAVIKDFINRYQFQGRLRSLNDVGPLLEWIEASTQQKVLLNWNVILAGKKYNTENQQSEAYSFDGTHFIGKVNRTLKSKTTTKDVYDIGVLINHHDMLADIDLNGVNNTTLKRQIQQAKSEESVIKKLRYDAKYNRIPQLIIYVINKDSDLTTKSQNRKPLHANCDIIGLCINIPGKSVNGNAVTIRINLSSIKGINEDADVD